MKAIAKVQAGPGLALIDAEEPQLKPGHVKLRVERGSVCGTDLHIYLWDAWAAGRIHPPRIIGHEFCGRILEVGEGVTGLTVGDLVASESHIVDLNDPDYLRGDGHVARSTSILGVDVDGGFAPYAVIPAQNARPVPRGVKPETASMLDALGNAVHTVMDGPVEGQSILITGLGPIGLFAAAICRTLGAKRIYATDISPYRMEIGRQLGIDMIFDPRTDDVLGSIRAEEGLGVDGVLEMSGRDTALGLAIEAVRPGGRISQLGVFGDRVNGVDMNALVFKGVKFHGIVGRRLWETWTQMTWLLEEKGLDVSPVITHEVEATDFESAFEILKRGEAGKIVLAF